jgi:hypothetical protein
MKPGIRLRSPIRPHRLSNSGKKKAKGVWVNFHAHDLFNTVIEKGGSGDDSENNESLHADSNQHL